MDPRKILQNVKDRALFVCNHSGGKDSQAMFKWMYNNLPHENLIIIHAHLPQVDWEGTLKHIHDTTFDIPVYVVQANKTFFEMVTSRGMWPSPIYRNCTSDLKISPISKLIRKYSKDNKYSTVYNCIGLRAEESNRRAIQSPIKLDKKLTTKSRTTYTVLPIHDYSIKEVFATYSITLEELQHRRLLYKQGYKSRALKQWPFIWTYVAGMSRHSCKICIMSKKSDLVCSSIIDPNNYQKFLDKELEIDHQFLNPFQSKYTLADIQKTSDQEQLSFENY